MGDILIGLCHQGWRTRNSEGAKWVSMAFRKMWVSDKKVLSIQGILDLILLAF